MTTRRNFLYQSAAALTAASIGRLAQAEAAPASAFGVQLYTVRPDVTTHPAEILGQIKRIGYTCVETYGAEYTVDAKTLRGFVSDAGLALPSTHFAYDDMTNRFDYARELGAKYIVCGSTPDKITLRSVEGFKRAAQQFNLWGEQARKAGLAFAFHNHNSEFQRFDTGTGLDILLAETDPHLVQWQPDCYWIAQAGSDPVQLMHKYGNRLQTLHFKDRKPGVPTSVVTNKEAQHFTEAGTGTIDFRAIWEAAAAHGVRYFFVEQDTTEMPQLQSLQVSYTNLKRLLG